MTMEILVLCPFGLDVGVVSKAAELSPGKVRVLVPEGEEGRAAACGATAVCTLCGGSVLNEAAFAEKLSEKILRWGSGIVLAPATIQMRNIMPMLAWKLHAGLTADCIALEFRDGRLIQTRPAFGSAVVAEIRSQSKIQMATVRPGIFRPRECHNPCAEVERMVYQEREEVIRCLSHTKFASGKPLSQAKIIIAGGMGVGSKKGFEKLARLADGLGAGLGASRAAVDAGLVPYRCQVGMTGATVHPKLYIAIGISGAVHHLAGMSGSEKVIAINTNPQAPIFDYADYGIIGPWEAAVDKLMEGKTDEL